MNWETTLKKITDETALNSALMWVEHPINLKLINNQINCVYRFEQGNQVYYLRMTHASIRPFNELEAAMDYQKHLFLNGAPVCQVIPSKSDNLIERMIQDDQEFLAHVCLEVPGTIMDFDHTEKKVYSAWGQALAKLHQASLNYQPKSHHFRTWENLWKETNDYLPGEEQDIQDIFFQIDAWFKQNTSNKVNFGLTHGDHRPGNVLFDGNQVHIIDFDEPVYHWYMADIAKPFLDLSSKPFSEWKHLFDWYIEGYRTLLPLDGVELQTINWFTQMKSLDIYLWCKNNWSEPTAPGGKPREQWLSELRQMAIRPIFNF